MLVDKVYEYGITVDEMSVVGNFDIHAEQKILFMNEMKWYKIRPRL
jgi:hypothetical protein